MKKLFILGVICLLCTISAVSQSKKEWERVQTLNKSNVYQQFINNYPNGKYTEQARQKQVLLKQPEQVKKVEEKKVVAEAPVFEKKVIAPVLLSNNNDPIVLKKKRYYLNDKQLSNKELKTLLNSQQESAYEYKKASTNMAVGTVMIGAGSVVLIISALNPPSEDEGPLPGVSRQEMNKHLTPVYIGAGIVLLGIPFILSGSKHFKKSINIYNSKQTAAGYRNELKLDIGLTRNGVGVTCYF